MKFKFSALVLASAFLASCSTSIQQTFENPTSHDATELLVEINSPEVLAQANSLASFKLMDNNTELAYEAISNGDSIVKILAQINLPANSKKAITITEGTPTAPEKKTQAEISQAQGGEWKWVTKNNGNEQWEYQGTTSWKNVNRLEVDEKHWDHGFDIRYEGPGWESDKVGYRFYLDWRNAVDVFGKRVNTPVLQNVGLDGFDSYHELADWGADIMKVGDALGIGSISHWVSDHVRRVDSVDSHVCEIAVDGLLQSVVKTTYNGWSYDGGKTDLISELTINAGSYLSKCHISLSNPIDNIATGIIKMPNTEIIQGENGEWCYFGTFGVQSLNKDELGLLVLYKKANLQSVTEDAKNHVIILTPENQGTEVTYYFGAQWTLDASGIKTTEQLKAYADQQVALLNAGLIK
ncbi:MAG: DUF4861 family protein [Mangrovibacterium sp.]